MSLKGVAAPCRTAGVLLALLVMHGCGGSLLQSDRAPPETYRLGTVTASPANDAPRPAPLPYAMSVVRPRAAAALDTDRIALVPAPNRFDYYTEVRWAEPAPEMLQHSLVAALGDTGRFSGVYATPARVSVELTLDVELRHFEADASAGDAAPAAHVQVQATLVDARRGQRLTSFLSEARVPAAENRRAAIVAAFERANDQVVRDVVTRIAEASAALPANSR
jgi:cholesterol transport system auxiliary component